VTSKYTTGSTSAAVEGVPRLTLYGRTYCHLCDDMLAALEAMRSEFRFDVDVVDVDADPAVEALYDELVPVLTANGRELCHYFLDAAAVREYLGDFR
jgi:thiol-disulfide isomerase/thioredoxin